MWNLAHMLYVKCFAESLFHTLEMKIESIGNKCQVVVVFTVLWFSLCIVVLAKQHVPLIYACSTLCCCGL